MLESVSLTNFKAFDDLELPLGRLTVLSGLNGTGKSSVIQALGVLRQSYDAGSLITGGLHLNGPLVEIGTAKDLLYQDFTSRLIKVGFGTRRDGDLVYYDWMTNAQSDADVLWCEEFPEIADKHELAIFTKGFQFLRADRITPSVTFPKSQYVVARERFLGARGEYTANYLLRFGHDVIVSPSRLHADEKQAAMLLAQLNAWMQEFSPGVRVEPESVPMTDLVRLAFSYRGARTSYGDPLRPTNVGFGLTHVLPVVTACLAAAPGSMLIIENPEAQLHPRGQAALGRLIALTAQAGVQVIIETHSDHVVNGIRLAVKTGQLEAKNTKLHFFTRTPGNATGYESPILNDDGRLSFWPRDFFDQWERSLDQLLS